MVNRYNDPSITIATTSGSLSFAFNVALNEETRARNYRIQQRPSQEGDPRQPFAMHFRFGYQGAGSSLTDEIPETYDYGQMEARVLQRLYPGLYRDQVTLSQTPGDTIRAIWVAVSPNLTEYVYAGGSTKVRKIVVSTNTDIDGTTFADGDTVYGPPHNWGDYWWLPRTGTEGAMRLSVGNGASTDIWTELNVGGNVILRSFSSSTFAGSTTPLLVGGDFYGRIQTASSDPTQSANWSAQYTISPPNRQVNALVTHDGNLYVATMAGIYVVDANVNGTPITTHLTNSYVYWAGRPTVEWHGKVYYSHQTGLYRVSEGRWRTVGIESWPAYQSAAAKPSGRVSAMASFGHWLYVAYWNGSRAFIMAGRERENGETGTGEMVWHTIMGGDGDPITSEIGAMCAYQGTDSINPRLYFGIGANLHFIILGKNGSIDPGDTNLRWFTDVTGVTYVSHNFAPNDNNAPNTLKVAETVEITPVGSLGSTVYFQVYASWDGAAAAQVGSNVTTTGYQTVDFTKGTNDSGRILKPHIRYYNKTVPTVFPYLDNGEIVVRGWERPTMVRDVTTVVELYEGQVMQPQGKTVAELLTQLRSWAELGTALTFTDNFSGETFTCRLVDTSAVETSSDAGSTPRYQVSLRLVEALN